LEDDLDEDELDDDEGDEEPEDGAVVAVMLKF
jgi:hypothetical protein